MTTKNETPENETPENETPEVDETALLDVISAAVDEVTPEDVLVANKTAAEQTPAEAEAAAAEAEVAAAEEKAAEEKAAAEAAEAAEQTPEEKIAAEKVVAEEKEATEKAAAEKAKADAKLTPEEKEAAEKVAKEAADKETAEAAAKVDPINDPIPESTNEKTATRIKALIQIAKDNTTRGDQGDEIVDQITATGADPDQYANTLGFLKLYNSKDPKDRAAALTAAQGVVRELKIELGQGTADLLENHDDLKAEIEAGTLTEARAIEIATGREKTVMDTARTDAASNKTATEQQTLTNIETGKAQLTTLEATLNASDTEYTRLRPTFIAMLQPALRKAHPTEWGEVAQEIYQAVKLANPVVEKPAPIVPVNTPLRPKGSGGTSVDKEGAPDSALAAVNAALGSM